MLAGELPKIVPANMLKRAARRLAEASKAGSPGKEKLKGRRPAAVESSAGGAAGGCRAHSKAIVSPAATARGPGTPEALYACTPTPMVVSPPPTPGHVGHVMTRPQGAALLPFAPPPLLPATHVIADPKRSSEGDSSRSCCVCGEAPTLQPASGASPSPQEKATPSPVHSKSLSSTEGIWLPIGKLPSAYCVLSTSSGPRSHVKVCAEV